MYNALTPEQRAAFTAPMITLFLMSNVAMGFTALIYGLNLYTYNYLDRRDFIFDALKDFLAAENSALFAVLLKMKRDEKGPTFNHIALRMALKYLRSCRNCRRLHARNEGEYCTVFPADMPRLRVSRYVFCCWTCIRMLKQTAQRLRIPMYVGDDYEFGPVPYGGPLQDVLERQLRHVLRTKLLRDEVEFEDRNEWICRESHRRNIYIFKKVNGNTTLAQFYLTPQIVEQMWYNETRRKKTSY